MHHALTALMAERYYPGIHWAMGTHAPPDHEDVPHLGGETGDGWFDLQDRLFRWWASRGERWILAQVKEKFAELTIYADPAPGQVALDTRALSYVATASQRVCESCGAPGRRAEGRGWYSTVCARHRSFAVQDRDATECDTCPTAAAVLACLAAQRTRPPEPEVTPDVVWTPAPSAPSNLAQRMQALDAAITWLLELDCLQLQPADLEHILDPYTVATLELPWTPSGLHRTTVIGLCHAALRTACDSWTAAGGWRRVDLVHLPTPFILPR